MPAISFMQGLYDRIAQTTAASERPVWHAELQRWFALDPDSVTDILRSPHFAVISHHEEIARIQEQKGIDLSPAINVANALALSHEGEEHRRRKRDSALLLQRIAGPALARVETRCAELVAELFDGRRSFDLISDLVSPLSACLFSGLSGVDEVHFHTLIPTGHCPSQLMSSGRARLSPQRWQALNQELSKRLAMTEGPPADRIMLSAMSLLNFEIVKAALSNSLIHVVRQNEGARLDGIAFPEQLPDTSIPFIDRVCTGDTVISGAQFRRGDNVYLYLGGCTPPSESSRKLFFGTGAHICIGRTVSEGAWSALAGALRSRPERLHLMEVSFRDLDLALHSPDAAIVEIGN